MPLLKPQEQVKQKAMVLRLFAVRKLSLNSKYIKYEIRKQAEKARTTVDEVRSLVNWNNPQDMEHAVSSQEKMDAMLSDLEGMMVSLVN